MRVDARVEDTLTTLAQPEDFVRGIVGSFIEGKFDKDRAVIRIGVSGTGVAPHYCIEQGYVMEKFGNFEMGRYERRGVFHGRSHNPVLEEDAKGLNWSKAAMRFSEIRNLLGTLRKAKRSQ